MDGERANEDDGDIARREVARANGRVVAPSRGLSGNLRPARFGASTAEATRRGCGRGRGACGVLVKVRCGASGSGKCTTEEGMLVAGRGGCAERWDVAQWALLCAAEADCMYETASAQAVQLKAI